MTLLDHQRTGDQVASLIVATWQLQFVNARVNLTTSSIWPGRRPHWLLSCSPWVIWASTNRNKTSWESLQQAWCRRPKQVKNLRWTYPYWDMILTWFHFAYIRETLNEEASHNDCLIATKNWVSSKNITRWFLLPVTHMVWTSKDYWTVPKSDGKDSLMFWSASEEGSRPKSEVDLEGAGGGGGAPLQKPPTLNSAQNAGILMQSFKFFLGDDPADPFPGH